MHKILITQGSCGTHAVEDCLKGEYNRDIPGFTHLVHEFGVLTVNHPSAPQLQGWNTHTNNPTVAPKNSKVVYLLANPYDTVFSKRCWPSPYKRTICWQIFISSYKTFRRRF